MTIGPAVPSTTEAVDTMLGVAGLSMSDDEYQRLLRIYPTLREQAASLRIPEVRYGEPAIIYSVREQPR